MKVDDGSGSFVRVRDIGVGSNPYDIAFGDIDGDRDIDIGVTNLGSNTGLDILRWLIML